MLEDKIKRLILSLDPCASLGKATSLSQCVFMLRDVIKRKEEQSGASVDLSLDGKYCLIKAIDECRNELLKASEEKRDEVQLADLTEYRYALAANLPYVVHTELLQEVSQGVEALDCQLRLDLTKLMEADGSYQLTVEEYQKKYTELGQLHQDLATEQEFLKAKGQLSRDKKNKIAKLQLQIEQIKTQMLLAFMFKMMISLDISLSEDEAKKSSWLNYAAFSVGAMILTAYGAAKGYTSIMALLSAASVKGAAAIASCSVTVSAFLVMYWAFETKALAEGLQVSVKSSRNELCEWERQFSCFDFCTEMLTNSMRQYAGRARTATDEERKSETLGQHAQVVSTPSANHAASVYKEHQGMLEFFYDSDLKSKHEKVCTTVNGGDTTAQKIGKGLASGGLSALNGLFVGFLGMSTVSMITHVAIGSALFAAGVCPYTIPAIIVGFAAGVLVSWFIKKHGKRIVDTITGREKIIAMSKEHNPTEAVDVVVDAGNSVELVLSRDNEKKQPVQLSPKVSQQGFFAATTFSSCSAQHRDQELDTAKEMPGPMHFIRGPGVVHAV